MDEGPLGWTERLKADVAVELSEADLRELARLTLAEWKQPQVSKGQLAGEVLRLRARIEAALAIVDRIEQHPDRCDGITPTDCLDAIKQELPALRRALTGEGQS